MSDDTASASSRLANRIFAAILAVVVLAVVLVLWLGLPALGIVGLVLTLVVFVVLLGFSAGN